MRIPSLPTLLLLIIQGLACHTLSAQYYEQHYFRNPLNIPISLAGSFGELRTGHFHTGIDIKTGGQEGQPVYAAANGYIRRIGISGNGYGNVLYIDHPNGFTTVYGHLQRFVPAVQKYIRGVQYKSESFEQDVILDSTLFPVKKGDLIAWSGNTGGSAGPHLHFEIRESQSERPVNPLLWGFRVKDTIPPTLHAIKIYPLDSHSYIKIIYHTPVKGAGKMLTAYKGQNIKLEVFKQGGQYYLKNVDRLEGYGKLGFSVQGYDFQNGSYNHVGVYRIELCVNDETHYMKQMRMLEFDMKRFINTHVDYPEREKTGAWFEKSFVSENNVLPIYDVLKDKGAVILQKGQTTRLAYYLMDVESNLSVLPFRISCPDTVAVFPVLPKDYDTLLPFHQNVVFEKPGFKVNIPVNTFYENLPLTFKVTPKKGHLYSGIYEFGTPYLPVHDYYDISIQAEELPERLQSKACIIALATGYQGGKYENGWITGRTRTLGKFYIAADTTPPLIQSLNIRENMNMSRAKQIRFIIRDNMSGIASYIGKIDGQYVLFQRDNKYALIYYEFDEHCPAGHHTLEMTVTDDRGNVNKKVFHFVR